MKHTVLHDYNVSRKFVRGFRGVELTRKTRLTDCPKTLYPPQLVAWDIEIYPFKIQDPTPPMKEKPSILMIPDITSFISVAIVFKNEM